jgi:hypothetical protein
MRAATAWREDVPRTSAAALNDEPLPIQFVGEFREASELLFSAETGSMTHLFAPAKTPAAVMSAGRNTCVYR